MGRFMANKPMVTTTVRISPEMHELCRMKGVNLTEALRIGIAMTLAERGEMEYDTNLNILRKLRSVQEMLNAKCIELEDIKDKIGVQNTFTNG